MVAAVMANTWAQEHGFPFIKAVPDIDTTDIVDCQ